MTKEIKKCYKLLKLPYNASLEDLKEKERTLIKDYKSREEKTGIKFTEDIAFVHIASEKIHDYIINNREVGNARFYTNFSELCSLLFTFILLVSCVITCFVLL